MNSAAPLPQGWRAPQTARPVRVLIIEADAAERRSIAGIIAERGEGRFTAAPFASAAEAAAALAAIPDSIVVANLETIGGTEALAVVTGQRATIATSTNPSLWVAVAAMRSGAADFLPKPIGARALIQHLTAMLAGRPQPAPAQIAPTRSAEAAVTQDRDSDFAGFIGRSPAMLAVYDRIARIAPSHASVFLTGESGTGKELAAEAIHAGFGRAQGRDVPFVALNCSAIPKDLMESEVFGHVRGAFTGASDPRAGAAELAAGGVLFLDEIAEMDLGLQAKLLRFVQTGQFRRVGGSEAVKVDVRFVSATNRDPLVEIAAGRLRADIFHRLYVLPLHMPPLRSRGDDIARLADAFLRCFAGEEGRTFSGFTAEAVAELAGRPWPGNVRELGNVVRRAVVLHDGPLLTRAMLEGTAGTTPFPAGLAPRPVAAYDAQERSIIEEAVAACGGSVARAAASLGISPATIYRKRHAWRMPPRA